MFSSHSMKGPYVRTLVRSAVGLMIFLPSMMIAQGGQPSIVSVVFNPSTIAGGRPASATITISGPAGNNGFDVSLSISSNVAQLSSSAITIGSGQTSTTVQVSTTPTATQQLATLTASARGETRTGNLTVSPPTVTNVTVSPAAVNSGQTSTGTVTLDGAAPSGGAIVNLSSNNAAATVPATVSVPQGQTSATFTINTGSVTAQTAATVGASVGTTLRNASLTVLPAPLALTSFRFSGTTLKSGDFSTLLIELNNPAPAGGVVVSYASTGVSFFGPTLNSDTIDAGARSSFRSFRVPVTSVDQPWTMTATLNGVVTSRSGTLLAPRIFALNAPDSVRGGSSFTLRASLNALPPSSGVPATVTVDNQAVIAPTFGTGGANEMTWLVRTNPVNQRTSVRITVTQLGSNGAALGGNDTTSIVVVPQPTLSTFTASPIVARVGETIVFTASLNQVAPAGGAVVDLDVTGLPSGMTMPPSITIPGGKLTSSISVATPSRLLQAALLRVTARFVVSKSVDVRIDR